MEHARPMAAPFLQTYLCMTRSRTKRTLQQQVLVRTKTAIRTSNKIPTAIHTPRSTRISLKISSPTMFSQHRLVAQEVLLFVEWLDGTDDGVYKFVSVYSRFVQGQQIFTFIMEKGKVVSLYRCDLWFLPVNAIRLLGKRGNKHYQTGIMEECGPETQGNTSGIAFVWNCLYTAIKNYDTIIILNNVSEFLTSPV